MRSVWINSILVAGLSICAGSMLANASETPKTATPSGQSSTATPSNSSAPSSSSSQPTSNSTKESTKTTPSGKTYQNYPSYPDRYTDEGDSVSTRHTSEHRSYRVVHRPVEHRHVEYRRPRVIYVERHHYRPVYRHVAHGRPHRAAPVYYYGQLVGRDPDASVRLMLLKDNARTMWAR
jgi:hypothetical protein